MTFNRAIKTEDKQEESGELGRKMDDRKGDGDGGFVHTLFFPWRSMLMYGSFIRGSKWLHPLMTIFVNVCDVGGEGTIDAYSI